MWCRAVLAAIALTYIVCVLILNGLQKEDLDVNTLRKLQRHNVNLDDMNNETLRKECETVTSESADETTPIICDNREEPKIKLSDSKLQNIIINYFNNVQKTNKPNNSEKVENEETKTSTNLPDVENFKNVWKMFSINKEHEIEEPTTEAMKTSTVLLSTRTNLGIDDKNMEYINNIFQKFVAREVTTTSRPTREPMDYGLLAQRIQQILANTSKNQQTLLPTQSTVAVREIFDVDNVNKQSEVLHNKSIQYIDDIIKLTYPYKIFGPVSDEYSSNKNKRFEHKTKRPNLVNDVDSLNISARASNEPPLYKNQQLKSISEDIIREISKSVKERVLQDLKKDITSKKTTFTTTYTTVKPTTTTTDKFTTLNVKHERKKVNVDATNVLEKLMEMFQQLKANKETTEPVTKKNIAGDTNIKTENNTRVTIALPPSYSFAVIKPIPVNITSVIINPYNLMQHTPVLETAILPNEPYTFMNINTPVNTKAEHKITQLNIFNTKHNYHTLPITIQTNNVEVPPLGMPAQQSVVYQNIVVPTNRPKKKDRYDFHSYIPNERKYDLKYKDLPYQRLKPRDLYNGFGTSRHERNKDIINDDRNREFINDEYAKELNKLRNDEYAKVKKPRNPLKYTDYGRPHYRGHNTERFHEKLERTDEWPRISRDNRNIDDNYSATLITRQQLPINDVKKRSRYDDAHFRNFLKTQQKVNDMLERILATKTIANGPRSVETTVD